MYVYRQFYVCVDTCISEHTYIHINTYIHAYTRGRVFYGTCMYMYIMFTKYKKLRNDLTTLMDQI